MLTKRGFCRVYLLASSPCTPAGMAATWVLFLWCACMAAERKTFPPLGRRVSVGERVKRFGHLLLLREAFFADVAIVVVAAVVVQIGCTHASPRPDIGDGITRRCCTTSVHLAPVLPGLLLPPLPSFVVFNNSS